VACVAVQFQLFATLQSAASESLPGVYAYLINCKETVGDMLPFPKQFGPWKDGCYLYEPVEGESSCLKENGLFRIYNTKYIGEAVA